MMCINRPEGTIRKVIPFKDKRGSINHILNPIQIAGSPFLQVQTIPAFSRESVSPEYCLPSQEPYSVPKYETYGGFSVERPIEYYTWANGPHISPSNAEDTEFIYTCVTHHQIHSGLGYGIFWANPQESKEIIGSGPNDKSVYRVELRAVLRALQLISTESDPEGVVYLDKTRNSLPKRRSKKWVIYTCHENAVKRMAGPKARKPSRTRGAPCMDLVLQIRSLMNWLHQHGVKVSICLGSRRSFGAKKASHLAKLGVDKRDPNPEPFRERGAYITTSKPNVPQRVYTDGSTFLQNGVSIAGYGIYFGYNDFRNECGQVLGKGTGPRACLAAILRAISLIHENHCDQKSWQIVSCRGQYSKSIFELSKEWEQNGWKRNAGKPIANLDMYREARRLLEDLESRGFTIEGVFQPQQFHDTDLMIADMIARRGAGDETIDVSLRVTSEPFAVPASPEDKIPCVVYSRSIASSPGNHYTERNQWQVYFGDNDSRNRNGWCPRIVNSFNNSATYAASRTLKAISNESERQWLVYTSCKEVVSITTQYIENGGTKPLMHLPPYLETVLIHTERLLKLGYQLTFKYFEENSDEHEMMDGVLLQDSL